MAVAAAMPAGATPARPAGTGMLSPQLAPLLLAIQEHVVFDDSKTAVDLTLRGPVEEVAAAAAQLLGGPPGSVTREALAAFVERHCIPSGGELVPVTPADWQPGGPPGWLDHLQAAWGPEDGARLRRLAGEVHGLWCTLCRQVAPEVAAGAPERSSLLPLPGVCIVPGDRFREVYYWDTLWVVRGLLACGMAGTATSAVTNLVALAEQLGHVPNGARCYYTNRSQPPLLSAMVRLVHAATGDEALLRRALPVLVAEHACWTAPPKQVTLQDRSGTPHNLSRYYADWTAPRPESHREDAALARHATGSADPGHPGAARLYLELASAAESGWDFSSRWCADAQDLGTIRTTQVIPADLNAFLYQMEHNVSWAADLLGEAATSSRFARAADARQAAMQQLLWDGASGCWRDGLLGPQPAEAAAAAAAGDMGAAAPDGLRLNPATLLSNYVPLWAGLTEGPGGGGREAADAVAQSLAASGLIYPGGLATTLEATGQQWDLPNGWPPLQHMVVAGLDAHAGPQGKALAQQLARTWVMSTLLAFEATGALHEKLDVRSPGGVGGGGEYAPQVGFGWSNGVLLDFVCNVCGAAQEAAAS